MNADQKEGWRLEAILCLLIGAPWYYFSRSPLIAMIVHAGLIMLYLTIELLIFGRGSAVMSFLLVLVLSVLAGFVTMGVNGGRLTP